MEREEREITRKTRKDRQQPGKGTVGTVTTEGGEFGEVRYKAFGENRYTSGTTPTTYRYTGQRQEAGIGLYFYGARWYDPALGRFISADTIVPGGVQGNDRYAYTNNNPINFTDPSGHGRESTDCGPDGIYCTKMPHLDLEDVNDPENQNDPTGKYPKGFIQPTWEYYKQMWQWLMDSRVYAWAIDPVTGLIDDIVLMAFIISGEFGNLKASASYAFNEAKEALSNQYDSTLVSSNIQCGGSCSLAEQIGWLSDVESWYSGLIFGYSKTVALEKYLGDATDAAGNYYVGKDTSWMWGDVTNKQLDNYDWVVKIPSTYPGKDWWIVH